MSSATSNAVSGAPDRTLQAPALRAAVRSRPALRATPGDFGVHRPIVADDAVRLAASAVRTPGRGSYRRFTIRGGAAVDEVYLLSRMDAALAMAAKATDANVKLIHLDMAGRYSVAAATLDAGLDLASVVAPEGPRA